LAEPGAPVLELSATQRLRVTTAKAIVATTRIGHRARGLVITEIFTDSEDEDEDDGKEQPTKEEPSSQAVEKKKKPFNSSSIFESSSDATRAVAATPSVGRNGEDRPKGLTQQVLKKKNIVTDKNGHREGYYVEQDFVVMDVEEKKKKKGAGVTRMKQSGLIRGLT
jgi:hypothetical protein